MKDNKLIAEFMGARIEKQTCILNGRNYFLDNEHSYEHTLQYHSSWDWLMHVVGKIESLKYEVTIHTQGCHITPIIRTEFRPKIQAVYTAVVEFIKWYNKQK